MALVVLYRPPPSPPPDGSLRLVAIDVGQGEALLLELPGGERWLVDGGGTAPMLAAMEAGMAGR